MIARISLVFLLFASTAMAQDSPIKSDEEVVFFPTVGRIEADGKRVLPVHGWIFEPENSSIRRNFVINSLCRALGLLESSCETAIFKGRARYFLVDNERGKSIPVVSGAATALSSASGTEGHFRAELRLLEQQPATVAHRQEIRYRALTRPGDKRLFEGRVIALEAEGISVISDVDDTVKVSSVLNRQELLANSFLRPFQPVGGIPELYRSWEGVGATFHYLTASPWQLYPALAEFFESAKLPVGSFHMKEFRWKDSRFLDLFSSPERFKPPILESLIGEFPRRRFVLVGDSGERDPEIYSAIMRRFVDQDIRVVIRELGEAKMDTARRERVIGAIHPERWRIVTDSELTSSAGRMELTEFISK